MLHACRIKGGKVSYCNRYVVTARLVRERSLGFPIYMRVSDQTAVAGCVVLLAGAVCTGGFMSFLAGQLEAAQQILWCLIRLPEMSRCFGGALTVLD